MPLRQPPLWAPGKPKQGTQARKDLKTYWLQTQLFNFWGSYKVVDSESFNFCFLGFWASENFLKQKSPDPKPATLKHRTLNQPCSPQNRVLEGIRSLNPKPQRSPGTLKGSGFGCLSRCRKGAICACFCSCCQALSAGIFQVY